jgi:hypothetical protein
MRPHLVEMASPRLDDDLGLSPRPEPFETEALVAELAVEALRRAILPWLAGIDQCRLDTLVDDPLQQSMRDELRTIVRTKIQRRAALADETVSTSITRPDRMRPSTSMARPSLVHSSVTVRHFNCWPLAHQSKTKSYDHT